MCILQSRLTPFIPRGHRRSLPIFGRNGTKVATLNKKGVVNRYQATVVKRNLQMNIAGAKNI